MKQYANGVSFINPARERRIKNIKAALDALAGIVLIAVGFLALLAFAIVTQ